MTTRASGDATSAAPAASARALPRGFAVAFGVTWLSYAAYYLGRKSLGVVKAPLAAELGDGALVGVDTAYLGAYAVGQYVSGWLGDRVGSRRLLGAGMLLSSAACFAFGLSGAGLAFALAFFVNGAAQSTGWPGNVKAMAEWTPPARRGVVMGLWSTCYQVGGVAATAAATLLLGLYGWRAAFHGPALAMALVGVVVLVVLRPGPGAGARREPAAGEAPPGPEPAPAAPFSFEQIRARDLLERRAAQARVLRSPAIWCFGASYFCIKLIRYSLLFWLPFYFVRALGYGVEAAGYLSMSFEVGGIAGTIGLGLLSDRFRALPRAAYAAASLVGLSGALFLFAQLGQAGPVATFAGMTLVGALLFGPDALLAGAATQEVGGPRAAATAAGIVNGIGSLGAILQEAVTRGVSARYGWGALFHVFVALALLAAAALVPALWWGRSTRPIPGPSPTSARAT